MRRKAGIICIILGIVFVFAALSLLLLNQHEAQEAGAAASDVLPRLKTSITQEHKSANNANSDGKKVYPDPYDTKMREVDIDGKTYIGYLSIPSVGMELPVMSEWSYPRLKIAPCRYYGSTKTGDMVICAHNFSRHFGPIKTLSIGDAVYFTDMDGVTTAYQVAEVSVLEPTDIEDMTDGGYPLTLFTCTYGGASRVTVRCDYASV